MPSTNRETLERTVTKQLELLAHELGESVALEEVREVGRQRFERLCRAATITDFVPLLVCRYTRDDVLEPVQDADGTVTSRRRRTTQQPRAAGIV